MFYTIDLYIEGVKTPVTIDKYLPSNGGKLFFASSGDKHELWVPFLEKAYAKLSGSFQQTDGGTGREALACLTGGPVSMRMLKDYPIE